MKAQPESPTAAPAAGALVALGEFATETGLDRSWLSRLIRQRGMPGEKRGGRWHVSPAVAIRWIHDNCPRSAEKMGGCALAPKAQPKAQTLPPIPSSNGQVGRTTSVKAERLGAILDVYLATMADGGYTPQVVTGVKQMLGELRLLERHEKEMKEADDRLIDRAEHERVVASIARIVVDEIEAAAPVAPDAMLSALTTGGVTLSDSRMALRLLSEAARGQAEQLRGRIADAIDTSDTL